ncbi:ABC transporter ATP-binding protein [Actinospica durhamensis]|uniref:ABC transporter ATP-binding protein n=1 Tax=Actinospica durhamensis TaxID=1508375 RepID=A0A941ELM7_9ACTN|nr:ABC transporter ATP-binding protein [Actinospica durhamensis]MBR7833153.1 ABC transporter ATP-binding protein [Actinospica durhamensis]
MGATAGSFQLRDVSLSLPVGYVMGFVGANGAGKTTTIRCLLGMQQIQRGEIEVLGHRVPGPVALRQDVGVVLDHDYVVGDWRLSEVERAVRPFYDHWDGRRYRELLEEFGLDMRAKVGDLSRGMNVKLMIALALSHQARLLVFDEPTSGLDPVARDELIGILGDFLLDEGHSVLFSTHITTDLERIGDYLTLIHAGRIVFTGTKEEVLDAYRVVRGGPDDLTDTVGVELIGLRRTATGVEAMVPAADAELLGSRVVVERPTLEEIVVRIGSKAGTKTGAKTGPNSRPVAEHADTGPTRSRGRRPAMAWRNK